MTDLTYYVTLSVLLRCALRGADMKGLQRHAGSPSLTSSGCSQGDNDPASWPSRRKRPRYGLSAALIASGSVTAVV